MQALHLLSMRVIKAPGKPGHGAKPALMFPIGTARLPLSRTSARQGLNGLHLEPVNFPRQYSSATASLSHVRGNEPLSKRVHAIMGHAVAPCSSRSPCSSPSASLSRSLHSSASSQQGGSPFPPSFPPFPPGGPVGGPGMGAPWVALAAVAGFILVALIGSLAFTLVLAFWPLFLLGLGFVAIRRALRGGGGFSVPATGVPGPPTSSVGMMGQMLADIARTAGEAMGAGAAAEARSIAALRACANRALRDTPPAGLTEALMGAGVTPSSCVLGKPWGAATHTSRTRAGTVRSVALWLPVLACEGGAQVGALRVEVVSDALPGVGVGAAAPTEGEGGWGMAMGNIRAVFDAARAGQARPSEAFFTGVRAGAGMLPPPPPPSRFAFTVRSAQVTLPNGSVLDCSEEWAGGGGWVSRAGDDAMTEGGAGPSPQAGGEGDRTVDLDPSSYHVGGEDAAHEREVRERRQRLRGQRRDS